MHSSRMRTADPYRDPPDRDPHRQRLPTWTETPYLDRECPGQRPQDRDPQTETPMNRDPPPPPGQRPPGHVTCGAWWNRDPPVNRITDMCKKHYLAAIIIRTFLKLNFPQLCMIEDFSDVHCVQNLLNTIDYAFIIAFFLFTSSFNYEIR